MFKIDVGNFADKTSDVVQVTQNIRIAKARNDAAKERLLVKSFGEWIKTANAMTTSFSTQLEVLEGSLTKFSDSYSGAASELQGELLPSYQAVLNAAGVGSVGGSLISFDDGQPVESKHTVLRSSSNQLGLYIQNAKNSLANLERSGSVLAPLDDLSSKLSSAQTTANDTYNAFKVYSNQVQDFEGKYASLFNPNAFDARSGAKKLSDGIGRIKNDIGIPKHVLSAGSGFLTALSDKMLGVGKTAFSFADTLSEGWKGFVKGAKESFDFLKPSKYREYWEQLKTGTGGRTTGGVKQLTLNLNGKVDKWAHRLEAGGKLLGYAANAISVFDIGVKTVDAYNKEKGPSGNKLRAATYEAVAGAGKFVLGKAVGGAGVKIGAALGTCIGGPIGGFIGGAIGGIVAGVIFDIGWNAAKKETRKKGGLRDTFVRGTVDRSTGTTKTSRGSP